MLLAAETEAGLCCNGGHGVANSALRGGGAAAVRTTEEMDPERVKRPAALACRVRGRAELRQAKARGLLSRRTTDPIHPFTHRYFPQLLVWTSKLGSGCYQTTTKKSTNRNGSRYTG